MNNLLQEKLCDYAVLQVLYFKHCQVPMRVGMGSLLAI